MWVLWARPYWTGYFAMVVSLTNFGGAAGMLGTESDLAFEREGRIEVEHFVSDEVVHAADVAIVRSGEAGGVERPSANAQIEYRICRVTAYCDRGTTAAGVPSGMGQCAAPGDIPFGTHVYIPALDRTFVVTDRTAKRFRQNTVDLFIPDCNACKQFGRHYLEVQFIIPENSPGYGSSEMHELAGRYRRQD